MAVFQQGVCTDVVFVHTSLQLSEMFGIEIILILSIYNNIVFIFHLILGYIWKVCMSSLKN